MTEKGSSLLLCTCTARWLPQLVEELDDKIHADAPGTARISLYGTTRRAQEGFLLITLRPGVPEAFKNALLKQMREDEDIGDYIVILPHMLQSILGDLRDSTL